jgi:hypothetical protein
MLQVMLRYYHQQSVSQSPATVDVPVLVRPDIECLLEGWVDSRKRGPDGNCQPATDQHHPPISNQT